MPNNNKNNEIYDENSIEVLEFPVCIQKKPSVYIGCIDVAGNTHLIREVIDNAVDEAMNGYGKKILVYIKNSAGFCSVEDEGRGIPAKAIEKAFCTIHASGKFNKNEYATSAGTNGIGCTAVNALSKKFYVECTNDGIRYCQEFSDGKPVTKLKTMGPTDKKGTYVQFRPNPKFMKTNQFDVETILNELQDKAYVINGVRIVVKDGDTGEVYKFYKQDFGSFVVDNCKNPLTRVIHFKDVVDYKTEDWEGNTQNSKFEYEMAFSYDSKETTKIRSFCNCLVMRDGGIQETSVKTAISKFFINYINENKLLSKNDKNIKITDDDCVDGLTCIISIKHRDPVFENQTKNRLTNREIARIKQSITEHLTDYAAKNPKEIKAICNRIILNAKASDAARRAKDNTKKKGETIFSSISDLSKLAPCISKDPSLTECFITEGRSASGTAKEARDKMYQAVYSLRGKMLNTLGMPTLKVLANKECADLPYVLTGIKNAIDEAFKIEYLKYNKVISLTDADVDGKHIVNLVLVYIWYHMRPIITEGHMYVAIPPLYSIIEHGKRRYFVDQYEYDQYIFNKVLELNKFVDADENPITSIEEISKIFNKYETLTKYIKKLVNVNMGISESLILDMLDYISENTFDKKTIVTFLQNTEDIKYNETYEGFYKNDYIFFPLKGLIDVLKPIMRFIRDNNIPFGTIYTYNEDESKYDRFNVNAYNKMIENVTPKSRVRMKGLGEMDPEELRDTTLDVNKRNIYKIEIPDVEAAEISMNNFMNDNSKYVEFRKHILLTKQDQVEL